MPSAQTPQPRGRFDFDEFAKLYDDATIDAIEQQCGEPITPRPRNQNSASSGLPVHEPTDQGSRVVGSPPLARRRDNVAVAGALSAGLLRGIDTTLDTEDKEPIIDFIEEIGDQKLQPVTVHLVPGNPKASVAIVRHWLL